MQQSGIHTLYDPKDFGRNTILDVVFIHGLQISDYEDAYKTTWESIIKEENGTKSKVLWPREWLGKEDEKEARIVSVSYNSLAIISKLDPCMCKNPHGFELIANKLLRRLMKARIGHVRPVILVGHSLGGLIIKQICIEANKPNSHFGKNENAFLSNIKGVFFYATPHLGAKLAKLHKMFWLLPYEASPLMKYLGKSSGPELMKLEDDFYKACSSSKWKTVTLVEGRKTPIFKIMV